MPHWEIITLCLVFYVGGIYVGYRVLPEVLREGREARHEYPD